MTAVRILMGRKICKEESIKRKWRDRKQKSVREREKAVKRK